MDIDVNSRVSFVNVKPHIGSIVNAERQSLFDPEVALACLDMLDQRGVLVFPKVHFTNEEQLAFTDLMGGRVNVTSKATTDENDDVYKVTLDSRINRSPEYVLGTFFWHMDGLTMDITPPRATLLSARKVAAVGGHTEFANTFAAYAHLTDEEKAEYEDLHVVHSVASSLRMIADSIPEEDQDKLTIGKINEYPLVRTDKKGRKFLVIGSTADRIVGQNVAHGRALLTRLVEWAAQPDFTYRHYWQEGDLVIWDNCAAMHRVTPYSAESGRMMHRTSIAGEA